MKKLVLEIELGDDAMRTEFDVGDVLIHVAQKVLDAGVAVGAGSKIIDRNGNTVGKWEVRV